MGVQDFSQKLVLVVRKDLPGWQAANTIGHISAYIGNKLGGSFRTGENFETKGGVLYPRNSQYAIIIKRANSSEQLKNLYEKVQASGLLYHGFVREMIDHTDDAGLAQALSEKGNEEVELLGVGVFGPGDDVGTLTKKFGLWE